MSDPDDDTRRLLGDTNPSSCGDTQSCGYESFKNSDHTMIATGRTSSSATTQGFYNKRRKRPADILSGYGDDQLGYLDAIMKSGTTDIHAMNMARKANESEGRSGLYRLWNRKPEITTFSTSTADEAVADGLKLGSGMFSREDVTKEAGKRKVGLDVALCATPRSKSSEQHASDGPAYINPLAYSGMF